ncbi:ParB/RepB/Spo0J family partition protein [Extensimonas perlucida]|uniref:ParB/RepB/Spo0J family partition protein n=1 Tax=Extensimonas perlucida TaxID=2590786 RepID=UPI0011A1C78F|nr:ParB N-terminal domain-containing protein [Extensimonas perlucida]
MTTAFPLHPAAELFPVMDEAAFAALVADIAAHGQREPILVLDGQVIDGRHRLRACEQLGLDPLVRQVSADDGDPFGLVVSLNLHRRHLSEGQRAIIAARLATLPHGRPDANAQICAFTQDEAAQHLKVSRRTVQHARAVLDHGIDELQAAVKGGEISVSAAAELSRLPADTQRAALTKTPEEIRAIAREVKARIKEAGVCGPSAVKIFDQVAADQHLSGIEQCAVVEVIKAEEPPLPTPSEAKRIAQQNRTLVLGSDGRYHGPEVSPESALATERWLALREGLESLCRIDTDPESLIDCVPHYQHQNLSAWLAQAVPLITRFDQAWKGARHA